MKTYPCNRCSEFKKGCVIPWEECKKVDKNAQDFFGEV